MSGPGGVDRPAPETFATKTDAEGVAQIHRLVEVLMNSLICWSWRVT